MAAPHPTHAGMYLAEKDNLNYLMTKAPSVEMKIDSIHAHEQQNDDGETEWFAWWFESSSVLAADVRHGHDSYPIFPGARVLYVGNAEIYTTLLAISDIIGAHGHVTAVLNKQDNKVVKRWKRCNIQRIRHDFTDSEFSKQDMKLYKKSLLDCETSVGCIVFQISLVGDEKHKKLLRMLKSSVKFLVEGGKIILLFDVNIPSDSDQRTISALGNEAARHIAAKMKSKLSFHKFYQVDPISAPTAHAFHGEKITV